MSNKIVTRGQTFANIAQQNFGSTDAVQKILDDNNLSLSSDCFEGLTLAINNDAVIDDAMKFDLSRFNFDPANNCEFSDFRKIINRNGIHPLISFDGIGTYIFNDKIFEVRSFNNVGRFNANGSLDVLDLRNFALHFIQIQDAPTGWQPINFGEYPELEIIKVINCPTLDISISDNYGKKLKILLENCKYVDFSNINQVYDDIEIEITNFIIARKNDDFCRILAEKGIVCGGGKILTLNGNTTPAGKLYLDELVAQGWNVTATDYEIPN